MNQTKCLLLFLSLLCAATSVAQEEFIEPSRFITRMRFAQLTGGVVVLRGCFSTFPDSLNFIFDTGSGGISLDSTTALRLGVKPVPSDRTIRGIAGIRQVSFLYNQQLHLPGLSIDSLNFHVNNYEVLTSVYGEQIDGIIGYSVLSRYIIKVDFDSLYLEFWTRGALKYPRGGTVLKPLISTLPVTFARVRDERALNTRFLFDMGAGLNMMLSTEFVNDSSLLNRKRKRYVKQAEGLGGSIDMDMTVIREVKLGPYKFRNVPVYIFNDTYNITSYPYLGGLIGNDLLRRFNLILNYEKRDIHLIPNSHFTDPFDYSYSGLELYLIDNKVILGDVAESSPAEKAGLREGDEVVAINKNFSGNLQQYKAALQATSDRLRVIVLRDGQLMQFEFKVKSVL